MERYAGSREPTDAPQVAGPYPLAASTVRELTRHCHSASFPTDTARLLASVAPPGGMVQQAQQGRAPRSAIGCAGGACRTRTAQKERAYHRPAW
jgi:hypothetical protein